MSEHGVSSYVQRSSTDVQARLAVDRADSCSLLPAACLAPLVRQGVYSRGSLHLPTASTDCICWADSARGLRTRSGGTWSSGDAPQQMTQPRSIGTMDAGHLPYLFPWSGGTELSNMAFEASAVSYQAMSHDWDGE